MIDLVTTGSGTTGNGDSSLSRNLAYSSSDFCLTCSNTGNYAVGNGSYRFVAGLPSQFRSFFLRSNRSREGNSLTNSNLGNYRSNSNNSLTFLKHSHFAASSLGVSGSNDVSVTNLYSCNDTVQNGGYSLV